MLFPRQTSPSSTPKWQLANLPPWSRIPIMRSHVRVALVVLAATTCFLGIFTVLRASQGHEVLSVIPLPERILNYGQQLTSGQAPNEDDDDLSERTVDLRILTSKRNTRGFYNKIDVKDSGYNIMNPTLLELPRGNGKSPEFLVIARTTHEDKEIKGKKYKLSRQVAMFANLTYISLDRPQLVSVGDWSRVMSDEWGGPEHHCEKQPDMDKYIGPEDMKLFWSQTGEPLLIFTYQVNDKHLCQGQFVVDVRAIIPELEKTLGPAVSKGLPPIRFKKPVGLRRKAPAGEEGSPRYQREKNWALVQSPFAAEEDELLFMVEPGQVYRYESENDPVERVARTKDGASAVEAPYPPHIQPQDTWHSREKTCVHDVMLSDGHIHQSTAMLSMTLCNRGTCTPTPENTVLLGMVQRRYDRPTWYDRRIATYSSVPPYNMLSVSKKLSYHGEQDGTYAWTGSMLYFTHHKHFPPPNHGFLDDEIWLSFGIRDKDAGWIDIEAGELVADHYLCEGASLEYRMRSGSSTVRSIGTRK